MTQREMTVRAMRRVCMKAGRAFNAFAALVAFLSLLPIAQAANWYVRPSQQGANNGTDWNNAWTTATINWSSVKPGDTIWLAGGTYSSALHVQGSGAAGNLVYVKRVLASDSVPASAAGWNGGFDSQVVISPGAGDVLYYDTVNTGSYMYFDGRMDSGIKLQKANSSGEFYPGCVHFANGAGYQQFITYTNIDMAGPEGSTPITHLSYDQCVSILPWSGTQYNPVSNVLFTHCRIHGGNNLMILANATYITFEYCKFYDNVATATSAGHPNMVEYINSGYITYRYSEFYNWGTEGFMPYNGTRGPLYIYGNIFRDPATGGNYARVLEPDDHNNIPMGPVYFFNNTCVNIPYMVFSPGISPWSTDSQVRNNIYWNCNVNISAAPNPDYDYSDVALGEAHGVNGAGQTPFVNLAARDLRISTNISAALPRNKGVALTSPSGVTYERDILGNLRGADGAWDIGAYEAGSSGSTTSNPTAVISLSAGSLDFGSLATGTTKDLTVTVKNIGGATLTGTASVAAPFSVVAGGSYNLASNASQVVTVRYSPTAAGNQSQMVSFTGGGGATVTASGSAWAVLSGLSFSAAAGTISSPFAVDANGFVSQPVETGVSGAGRAVYGFNITNAGNYYVVANVNAPDASSDSFFINIDADPTDPDMIWDVIPDTTGMQTRIVGWRGSGTFDNPQFPNKVFTLTTGGHQLVVLGREANAQLGSVSIVPVPPPPQNLRVMAGP